MGTCNGRQHQKTDQGITLGLFLRFMPESDAPANLDDCGSGNFKFNYQIIKVSVTAAYDVLNSQRRWFPPV